MKKCAWFSLLFILLLTFFSCETESSSADISLTVLSPQELSVHGYTTSDVQSCTIELVCRSGRSLFFTTTRDSTVTASGVSAGDYVARAYGIDNMGTSIAQCATLSFSVSSGGSTSQTLQLFWTDRDEYKKTTDMTCAVKFDTNGGSAVSRQIVQAGSLVTRPENPTKRHYSFASWYWDASLTNEFDFSEPVYCNLTLHASWQYTGAELCTVTFESNGGTAIATQTVTEGECATEPDTPTKEGYTFEGWYTDSKLRQAYDFSSAVTEDITLYAKWVLTCKVTFFKNDGTTDSNYTNCEKDNPFWFPGGDIVGSRNDGYYFLGWATSANATSPEFYSGDYYETISEELSFYAVWTNEYYTLTLVNSYTQSQKMTKRFGKNSKASINDVYDWANPFTGPTGYRTYGYATSASATAWDSDLWGTLTIDSDKTFYQLWALEIVNISNIYDENGIAYQDYTYTCYGAPITAPDYTTSPPWYAWEKYTFAGFYTDDTYTTALDFSTLSASDVDQSTGRISIYSKWLDKASLKNGISVTLQSVSAPPELSLTLHESTNTFTATSGFSSYVWRIDGTKATETSYQYTVNTASLSAGVHNVTVAVRDETGSLYSARAVIKVEKE